MRLFGRKLFENAYQQLLTRGGDYRKTQDPAVIAKEMAQLPAEEATDFMAAMHMWHHRFSEGFSIADVVGALDYARFSRPYQDPTGNGRDNIDSVVRGGEAVITGLIRHANKLAAGIESGAPLANAFGDV